jgi:hypothetical protein
MSEDSPNREPDATTVGEPTVPELDVAPLDAAPAIASAPARRGPPRWLPYLIVAIVPAVVVGIAVALLAGGGGDKDRSAAVIDGFVHSNGPSDSAVTSFRGQFPPGFPKDFPIFGGAKTVSSFLVASDEGRHYFAVLSTKATAVKVYDYYLGVMDKDPWQVSVATAGGEFTGMRFNNSSNPNVEGEVAIYKSTLDDLTNIYITYQDESAEAKRADKPSTKYVPTDSHSLPPGFPSDVTLYDKGGTPNVIETYFERSSGKVEYSVSFLTKGSQSDVIKAYDDAFKKKGWDTREPKSSSRDFSLGLAFTNNKEIEGTVSVDTFEKDDQYQKVDVFVSVSKGSGTSSSPSTALTPRAGGTPVPSSTPRQGN